MTGFRHLGNTHYNKLSTQDEEQCHNITNQCIKIKQVKSVTITQVAGEVSNYHLGCRKNTRIIRIKKFHVDGLTQYCKCIISLGMMLLRFNHKVYQYFFCSFVLLSSFPLYGCDKSIRWHNFQKSIHQLTKYPGCFPFGIIMNKATMNISQNKLCSFFLDKFQGVGTLSHMVHVC